MPRADAAGARAARCSGMDLDERADAIGQALRAALAWIADRGIRPLNVPRWLPTPGQRRARSGNEDAAWAGRGDPRGGARRPRPRRAAGARLDRRDRSRRPANHCRTTRSATSWCCSCSPDTTPRRPLSTYALWALGRHRDMQDRLLAEVSRTRRAAADPGRRAPARSHRAGAARGAAAVPARCRNAAHAEQRLWLSTAIDCRPAPWRWSASTPCTATRNCGTDR